MSKRRIGQMSWPDIAISKQQARRRDRLEEISRLLDWSRFDAMFAGFYKSRRGEPSYPCLMMFKALLLQRWYNLGDEDLEEALLDRLSFRRFCGLSLEDTTPDHTTFWRFRERLVKKNMMLTLVAELTRQLDDKGMFLKQGTLIDASIVESAARRPRMKEGKISRTDPDARFGTGNQRGNYTFGYKLHIATDMGTGLIRGLDVTPANIQEVMIGPGLIQGDEAAVYADRGYDAARMRTPIAEQGAINGILKRRKKGETLTAAQTRRNHALSLKRRPVENVFGTLKRSYRMDRMRYFNQPRNTLALALACFAYNLRRMRQLTPA